MVCVELITLVNSRVFLGNSVDKVLLDSVIVGKLNHDLRTKKNLKLLEWVNVCMKGLTKIFELKK